MSFDKPFNIPRDRSDLNSELDAIKRKKDSNINQAPDEGADELAMLGVREEMEKAETEKEAGIKVDGDSQINAKTPDILGKNGSSLETGFGSLEDRIRKTSQVKVNVQRSSGEMEEGWTAVWADEGGVLVVKPDGKEGILRKKVSLSDLEKWNPPISEVGNLAGGEGATEKKEGKRGEEILRKKGEVGTDIKERLKRAGYVSNDGILFEISERDKNLKLTDKGWITETKKKMRRLENGNGKESPEFLEELEELERLNGKSENGENKNPNEEVSQKSEKDREAIYPKVIESGEEDDDPVITMKENPQGVFEQADHESDGENQNKKDTQYSDNTPNEGVSQNVPRQENQEKSETNKQEMEESFKLLMEKQEVFLAAKKDNSKLNKALAFFGRGKNVENIEMFEAARQELEDQKADFRKKFAVFSQGLIVGKKEELKQTGLGSAEIRTELLKYMQTEKMIDSGEKDKQGNEIKRSLSEEYNNRLFKIDQVRLESLPSTAKGIFRKAWDGYRKLSPKARLALSFPLILGIGAATGGLTVAGASLASLFGSTALSASALATIGATGITAKKIATWKLGAFTGALGAGATDNYLRRSQQLRNEERGETEKDFDERAQQALGEKIKTIAEKEDENLEEGLLEGVEQRKKVLDDKIAHQKRQARNRMIAAGVAGVAAGGGAAMFAGGFLGGPLAGGQVGDFDDLKGGAGGTPEVLGNKPFPLELPENADQFTTSRFSELKVFDAFRNFVEEKNGGEFRLDKDKLVMQWNEFKSSAPDDLKDERYFKHYDERIEELKKFPNEEARTSFFSYIERDLTSCKLKLDAAELAKKMGIEFDPLAKDFEYTQLEGILTSINGKKVPLDLLSEQDREKVLLLRKISSQMSGEQPADAEGHKLSKEKVVLESHIPKENVFDLEDKVGTKQKLEAETIAQKETVAAGVGGAAEQAGSSAEKAFSLSSGDSVWKVLKQEGMTDREIMNKVAAFSRETGEKLMNEHGMTKEQAMARIDHGFKHLPVGKEFSIDAKGNLKIDNFLEELEGKGGNGSDKIVLEGAAAEKSVVESRLTNDSAEEGADNEDYNTHVKEPAKEKVPSDMTNINSDSVNKEEPLFPLNKDSQEAGEEVSLAENKLVQKSILEKDISRGAIEKFSGMQAKEALLFLDKNPTELSEDAELLLSQMKKEMTFLQVNAEFAQKYGGRITFAQLADRYFEGREINERGARALAELYSLAGDEPVVETAGATGVDTPAETAEKAIDTPETQTKAEWTKKMEKILKDGAQALAELHASTGEESAGGISEVVDAESSLETDGKAGDALETQTASAEDEPVAEAVDVVDVEKGASVEKTEIASEISETQTKAEWTKEVEKKLVGKTDFDPKVVERVNEMNYYSVISRISQIVQESIDSGNVQNAGIIEDDLVFLRKMMETVGQKSNHNFGDYVSEYNIKNPLSEAELETLARCYKKLHASGSKLESNLANDLNNLA